MHAVGYILVILKSFTNPLIFAFRQSNIQQALISLFYRVTCRKEKALLSRVTSRYSSFTRSSNRFKNESYRVQQPGSASFRAGEVQRLKKMKALDEETE